MPRIKPLTMAEQRKKDFDSELAYALKYDCKNVTQVYESIGFSRTTWYRRRKRPETFTMDELRKMKRILPSFQFSI